MNASVDALPAVEELTHEQGVQMLNGLTRDRLDLTAAEFLAKLDAGDYDDSDDEFILKLVMLAPFAR